MKERDDPPTENAPSERNENETNAAEEKADDEDAADSKRSDPLDTAGSENLRAGRRFYYSIILVAVFLAAVLAENDPARVPVLNQALDAAVRYKDLQGKPAETWSKLTELARSNDQEIAEWYSILSEPRVSISNGWLALAFADDAFDTTDVDLEKKISSVWYYLECLKPHHVDFGLSIDTNAGAVTIAIPTDQPTLALRTKYLSTFSGLVERTLRDANLRIKATVSAGDAEENIALEFIDSKLPTTPDRDVAVKLAGSKLFGRIAWALNSETYNKGYFAKQNQAFTSLRRSLVDLGMWETVTRVQYNPSLIYTGGLVGKVEFKDDRFFNEVALDQTIADLRGELSRAGKKLKIPLTSYEARSDTTVLITTLIMVGLYIAYGITLENIRTLESRRGKREARFFPWAIFWGVGLSHSSVGTSLIRRAINLMTLVHAFLGAVVIGWTLETMLRLRTFPSSQVVLVCFAAAASIGLGFYCQKRIRRIQACFR